MNSKWAYFVLIHVFLLKATVVIVASVCVGRCLMCRVRRIRSEIDYVVCTLNRLDDTISHAIKFHQIKDCLWNWSNHEFCLSIEPSFNERANEWLYCHCHRVWFVLEFNIDINRIKFFVRFLRLRQLCIRETLENATKFN